jgi:hypothetical protein
VRQAEGDVDLDVDRVGFDAEDSGTAQAGEHDAGWICKKRRPVRLQGFPRKLAESGSARCAPCNPDAADFAQFLRTGQLGVGGSTWSMTRASNAPCILVRSVNRQA